jgi:hypothetical protein
MDLFNHYGSIEFARAALRDIVSAATSEFETAYQDAPPSSDKEFLRGLIPLLGARDI